MSKLCAITIQVKALSESQKKDMYELFSHYYENLNQQKFFDDLNSKEKVILLKDQKGIIRGFSTLMTIETKVNGKKVLGIFTGDTVIHDDFWGGIALTLEFFKNVSLTKLKNAHLEVYWFLISKGYKTYLLLTNNFKTYYPRYDVELQKYHHEIINSFGKTLYADEYDEDSLLVKAAHKYDRLKSSVAPITQKMMEKNPNIAYFNKMNPHWSEGDELCCIGKVDLGLAQVYLSRTIKKFLRRGLQ